MPRIITSDWTTPDQTGSITYTNSDSAWYIRVDQGLCSGSQTACLTEYDLIWPQWVTQQSALGCQTQVRYATASANTAGLGGLVGQAGAGLGAYNQGLGGWGGNANRLSGQRTRTVEDVAREAAYEAQLAARLKEIEEVEQRASALLLMTLDRDQTAEYQKTKSFIVHTADRKRRYQVRYGVAGNILLLNDTGLAVAKFCIHPQGAAADGHDLEELPTPDVMLAQKLIIETDEKLFLKIANKTTLAAPFAA